MSAAQGQSRILVVGLKGNRQGTEMAVDNFVRAVAGRVSFDYLYHEEPAFDGCRLPGNRAFTIPRKSRDPLGYRRGLRRLFDEHAGEWSAVWLNTGNLANIDSLVMAERYGVPRRIVHAHSDTWLGGRRQVAETKLHHKHALALATDRWACSEGAGRLFFGDEDFVIVPDAIPLKRYAFSAEDRKRVRGEYDLEGRFVIGSVGALIPRKNHAFLVRILPDVIRRIPNAELVVVGEGEERANLEMLANDLGIESRAHLVGSQEDVPAFLSAFDVFAFPSVHEGLGLALVEAQANGLPVAASSACTRDVAITDSISYLDLSDEGSWLRAIVEADRERVHLNKERSSQFDLDAQADLLVRLFCERGR